MKRTIAIIIALLWTGLVAMPVGAESYGRVPAKLQAALIVKVLGMSREIDGQGEVSIHVLSDPETLDELRKGVGRPLGKSTLAEVTGSGGLPGNKPSAIYIGAGMDAAAILEFCRSKGVLSICADPALVERGGTLGFGMEGDKPKILLNLSATKAEGITWNPVLYKISRIFN